MVKYGIQKLTAVGLLAALIGCSEPPAETGTSTEVDLAAAMVDGANATLAEQASQLAEMDKMIRSMVGTAQASSYQQCRLLAVGSRPCGGPEYYIAYSTESVDEATLLKLAEDYAELKQAVDAEQNIVGTCEVIPEPKLVYVDGYCRAAPASTM